MTIQIIRVNEKNARSLFALLFSLWALPVYNITQALSQHNITQALSHFLMLRNNCGASTSEVRYFWQQEILAENRLFWQV